LPQLIYFSCGSAVRLPSLEVRPVLYFIQHRASHVNFKSSRVFCGLSLVRVRYFVQLLLISRWIVSVRGVVRWRLRAWWTHFPVF